MSKLYTIPSNSKFYPLPPLTKVEEGVVYSPHPLFAQFYSTYSRAIDKDYYLDRFDQRYDNEPNQKILDIWGKDDDMKEWAAISSIMDERIAGISMRMFMLGESPFYMEDYIRAQRPFFSSLVRKTKKILPSPRIVIETNKYLNYGNLQLLLHVTKQKEYLYWNWEEVVSKTLELMPNKGMVEDYSEDFAPRIINLLMDHQFEEIEMGLWERKIVPTKTLYFNTVL